MYTHEERSLPTLLGETRQWRQQTKAKDAASKYAVRTGPSCIHSQTAVLKQTQTKGEDAAAKYTTNVAPSKSLKDLSIKDLKTTKTKAMAQTYAPAKATRSLKTLSKTMNCKTPNTTGTSNVCTLFRTLGENETIKDYFSFGEEIYDGGQRDKVLNAKKKKVQADEIADCVVKVQRKRRFKRGESEWRAVMKQLFASKVGPHVLKIETIFEDDKAFYVVMEKCSGGELFTFLENATEVSVAECKRIIREILLALNELHGKGLFHGDVKPENIMFADGVNKSLKLIDFDTCQPWSSEAPKAQSFTGSPGYISPEAFLGKASPQSDLWAAGVILFILMTGSMPFDQVVKDTEVDGPNAKAAYEDLRNERLDWNEEPWPEFPVAADLCQQLLAFDPAARMESAADALQHDWFQQRRVQ
jgi:myosin-light-chain kinase